jgi:hypothetical protein
MSEGQLASAEQTMTRLARIAPLRWEPDYNLGVINALMRDFDGARAWLAALRAKNPAMADALEAEYLAPEAAGANRADLPLAGLSAAVVAPELHAGSAPGRLTSRTLRIGARAITLPPGRWFLASASQHLAKGKRLKPPSVPFDDVTVVTGTAFSLNGSRLYAAVSVTANPVQAFGTTVWNTDDACAVRGAIHVDRFGSSFERPECLYVRTVDQATALGSTSFGSALQFARAAGAALPAAWYEVHYSRYGLDWLARTTWLLPMDALTGDKAVMHWARVLADELRPMADGARGVVAVPVIAP